MLRYSRQLVSYHIDYEVLTNEAGRNKLHVVDNSDGLQRQRDEYSEHYSSFAHGISNCPFFELVNCQIQQDSKDIPHTSLHTKKVDRFILECGVQSFLWLVHQFFSRNEQNCSASDGPSKRHSRKQRSFDTVK